MPCQSRPCLLLSVLVCGACVREAPPGSGAVETTPSAASSASAVVTAAPPAPLAHVLGYPNGGVLLVAPIGCRVTALELERTRWTREFAACAGHLEAAVASDSMVYARTEQDLYAIGFDGAERWHVSLPVVPPALLAPTSLADSRAVVARSPRVVVALAADGKPAWEFSVPSEEALMSAPVGLKTEGVALVTTRATYVLGSGGELRWRTASASSGSRP